MLRRPRRTLSAVLWVALLGAGAGCATDPVAAPRTAAAARRPARDASLPYPTTAVSMMGADGVYTLDPNASTLTGPAGIAMPLAPDALDYFVTAWQRMQDADQSGQAVEQESARRRASQPKPPPAPPCHMGPNGRCVADGDPQSVPRRPGVSVVAIPGTVGTQSTAVTSVQGVDFSAITDWNCRDIAIAMRDEMVDYRAAEKEYRTAILTMYGAAIKNGSDITPNPKTGQPYFPVPQTLGKLFWYYSLFASAGSLEVAAANFEIARTRIGVLGTQYALQDCLHRDWDPPVEQSPASGSHGGGGNGGSYGVSVCYYEFTRVDGMLVNTRLLYCLPQ